MTKFFTVEQVIELHDVFLEDHGGLPGIRDKGFLISAVEMPRASMQNLPFNDGNKRTGALTTILFLEENGIKIAFSDHDYEVFVVSVAQGQKNKEEIAYFLRHGKLLSR